MPDGVVSCERALAVVAGLQERLYRCMVRRRDALWELTLAVAALGGPVRSVAELMLQPGVRRGWGSLYQGLEHGRVDVVGVRAAAVGLCAGPGPLLFAVDASKIPRPDARVCPDVGMQFDPKRIGSAIPGWSMLACVRVGLAGLTGRRSSWVVPVDAVRVSTVGNANEAAAAMMGRVTAALVAAGETRSPVFVHDSGFCPVYLDQHRPEAAQILVRLRGDRVFWGRPAARVVGAMGRPRRHGDRFGLDEPDTWGPAHAQHTVTCPDGSTVSTRAWEHKHPQARQRRKWAGTEPVEGTLIRREHTHRDGRIQVWWLWWSGPDDAFDLPLLAQAYVHRYTIEHWFRFLKQDMFWAGHATIDPDQIERWTWILICAYLLLLAARDATVEDRLPWQRPLPAERLTPRRVQRGFLALRHRLPVVAKPPKLSKPGTGRPPGSRNRTHRPPQPIIKKGNTDKNNRTKKQPKTPNA